MNPLLFYCQQWFFVDPLLGKNSTVNYSSNLIYLITALESYENDRPPLRSLTYFQCENDIQDELKIIYIYISQTVIEHYKLCSLRDPVEPHYWRERLTPALHNSSHGAETRLVAPICVGGWTDTPPNAIFSYDIIISSIWITIGASSITSDCQIVQAVRNTHSSALSSYHRCRIVASKGSRPLPRTLRCIASVFVTAFIIKRR